jgi:hypothetical protein
MSIQSVPVTDVKVYQLNICEALGDHDECAGMDALIVGFQEIGMVVCNCHCHGNNEGVPN